MLCIWNFVSNENNTVSKLIIYEQYFRAKKKFLETSISFVSFKLDIIPLSMARSSPSNSKSFGYETLLHLLEIYNQRF